MQQPVRIESIAGHLDLLETVSGWHFNEWGDPARGDTLAAWSANLQQYINGDRIPTIFVALAGTEPLGSVSLNQQDMSTHPELSPWLSGMYVKPAARGCGVARALVLHALAWARMAGIPRLYLYTRSARGLYEKTGWQVIPGREAEEYEGRPVAIMTIGIDRPHHSDTPAAR